METFTEVNVCVELDGTILTKVEFINDLLASDDWAGTVVLLMVVNDDDSVDGCSRIVDEIFLLRVKVVKLVFVVFKTVDGVADDAAIDEVIVEILPRYTVEFSTTIDIVDVIVTLVKNVESA